MNAPGDAERLGAPHFSYVVYSLCIVLSMGAELRGAAAEHNLALGRSYSLSPDPNYPRCTDKGDAVQLTDGKKRGCNWLRKSSVGWKNPATPPSVLIDLGRVEPIDEVRIHSVGGGFAGVFFPARILVLVGDDRTSLHAVAALDDQGLMQDRWAAKRGIPYIFRAENLRTKGRYVQVTLVANQSFAFMDEVEVIRGGHSVADVQFAAENRFDSQDVGVLLASLRGADRVRRGIDRLQSALVPGEQLIGQTALLELRAALNDVRRRADATPGFLPDSWRRLEAELLGVRGRWLAERWGKPVVWRQQNPMLQLRPGDVFFKGAKDEVAGLEIELWQGEYESAALTLVNCSEQSVNLQVSITPLRDEAGQDFSSGDTITLRRGVFVEAPGVGVLADALIKLRDDPLPIAAGSAGQLWLTVHNPDLKPGTYHFGISLRPTGSGGPGKAQMAQGRLVVHPIRFPDRPSLKTMTWGYITQFGLNPQALAGLAADLSSHYMNVYVVPASDIPDAKLKPDGTLRIDFRRHDAGLRLFPNAEEYLFFWAYSPKRKAVLNRWGQWMSPPFKSAMRQYLTKWVAHLRELGIGYDRFTMYPFDESLEDEYFELARFIKEVDPRIRLFANSSGKRSASEADRFIDYVDTWCLPEKKVARSAAVRAKLKRHGDREVWRYATSVSSKSLSPYQYYRLRPWRAWADGDVGCGFWVYTVSRQKYPCSDWDDFACARGRWSVVYDGRDAPVDPGGELAVPSRRWEAWREGIEDYEYLHTLKTRIADCGERGIETQAVTQAKQTLGSVVADVLSHPGDPDVVYAARRRLVAAIVNLNEALGMSRASK